MVKHIILWTLKEELPNQEHAALKAQVKQKLEALQGKIEGLLKIEVLTEPLSSSNTDMMLYSEFIDEAALAHYQQHPSHLEAASFVKSIVGARACMDFQA